MPAFVYRWLKDTAATPYLRTGDNPNLRSQDGPKRHWFCRDCEDQIGRFEKAFAENLFPLVVTEHPAPYRHGPWLSRFLASVAWRAAMLISEQESFDFLTPEQRALLPEALEHWRTFIRGDTATPGVHELHFLPLGIVGEYEGDRALPPNINRYTLRSIEVHMAGRPSEAFVFVKMGPALMLGFIQPPLPEIWQGTRVALGDGQVGGRMATRFSSWTTTIRVRKKCASCSNVGLPVNRRRLNRHTRPTLIAPLAPRPSVRWTLT